MYVVGIRVVHPSDAESPGKASFWIEVERELTYTGIPEDSTEAEIEAFGNLNAFYNAWPFLRVDLHELSLKMGLAPLVLPLHRIIAPPKGKSSKELP
jgi:hypothetical protein